MKLSRIQKIIRNTTIVIVLLAVLPLLFDMHFSPDKAAHEALEKAGCEDTEYIAQYTVKRGNNDKGSASVEKDMLSEDAYEQAENSRRVDYGNIYYYSCSGGEYTAEVRCSVLLGIIYRAESVDIKKTDYGIKAGYISNYEDDIENMIVFYDGENGECSGYIYNAGIFPELGDKNRIDFRIYEVKNGDVYMDMDICRLDSSGFLKDGNREAEITAKYNISKRKTTEYDSRGGSLFDCDRIISSESENALYLETSECAETHLNMSKDRLEYIRSLILDSAEENGLLV